jgi:tetratricopeptide (TPR) repeat protein
MELPAEVLAVAAALAAGIALAVYARRRPAPAPPAAKPTAHVDGARERAAPTELQRRLAAMEIALADEPDAHATALRRGIVRGTLTQALTCIEAGHVDEALAMFTELLEDLDDDPAWTRTRATTHALRALAYEVRAQPGAARDDYRRAVALDPDHQAARRALERLG